MLEIYTVNHVVLFCNLHTLHCWIVLLLLFICWSQTESVWAKTWLYYITLHYITSVYVNMWPPALFKPKPNFLFEGNQVHLNLNLILNLVIHHQVTMYSLFDHVNKLCTINCVNKCKNIIMSWSSWRSWFKYR